MSRQNTRCRRPGNRIPELCAPITRAHPRSRDLFTPADPPRPTCTPRPQHRAPRLHLPVTNTRARADRVQVAPTEIEAATRVRGAPSRAGCERGAPTTPPQPWGPSLASSACGRWRRPLSQGPREARAPRGWKSPSRWPLGRRGHAVRGSR